MPGAFRTLLSGFEPHGRRGRPDCPWAPEGQGNRRHHRPISEANALLMAPAGRYHSVVRAEIQFYKRQF
jgi:hypothetical protein